MRRTMTLCALLAGLAIVPGLAQGADVQITNAWFRALPSNLPAGGYFTIENLGNKPITIAAVQSPACGMLMLHRSITEGGVSSMSGVQSVSVPAHERVMFAPGGYHLMCMQPTAALKPGSKVDVTLTLDGGQTQRVHFAVRNARGQ